MKILSPVDNLAEVDALIDAGADELYGGYVSGGWAKKYSIMSSANQRYFPSAQIQGEAELKGIIKVAHSGGARFYLTLNAPYYTEEQYGDITREAREFSGMGVDAFIVADIGLILRLKDAMPYVDVHLSTLSEVFNGRAASFYSRLGVRRMVLPRELTTAEMAGIIKAHPELDFDAFILVGKCPNIEGYCSFTHNNPKLIWPCEEPYQMEALADDGRTGGIIRAQSGWSSVNRRQACGLCALPMLVRAGITALKLVGRGGPTGMKVKAIGAVKRVLGLVEDGMDEGGVRPMAMGVYKELFGQDCNPYVCYFPEVWR